MFSLISYSAHRNAPAPTHAVCIRVHLISPLVKLTEAHTETIRAAGGINAGAAEPRKLADVHQERRGSSLWSMAPMRPSLWNQPRPYLSQPWITMIESFKETPWGNAISSVRTYITYICYHTEYNKTAPPSHIWALGFLSAHIPATQSRRGFAFSFLFIALSICVKAAVCN